MKLYQSLCLVILMLINPFYSHGQQDSLNGRKDGVYTGVSRSVYINEEYWGTVHLTVKKGILTDVRFIIRDSALHETFNLEYAKHFEGNDLYIRQTMDNLEGMKKYQDRLLKVRVINDIDVISGATWSYNIFRDAVRQALKE